jgi:hypothetical protein
MEQIIGLEWIPEDSSEFDVGLISITENIDYSTP